MEEEALKEEYRMRAEESEQHIQDLLEKVCVCGVGVFVYCMHHNYPQTEGIYLCPWYSYQPCVLSLIGRTVSSQLNWKASQCWRTSWRR